MTGTIKSLDRGGASGVITAEDGLMVGFRPSAVLAYDLPALVVGQAVNFDLEDGRHPKALNIYVQRAVQAVNAAEKRLEITRLRYLGFDHKGGTRVYHFERLVPGATKRTFTVDADLALFTKHHVKMQEGPAISFLLLVEEMYAEATAIEEPLNCALSDREMLAYVARHPLPRPKQGPKRTQPDSGATSEVR